ncbi:MAG: DUF305 domain-containing protein [Candidatus Limnocylindrales bacterium]|jgi:hypothetical protein
MSHYIKFGITLSVSLLLMFVLSMSMIVSLDHFYLNLSNFYMALIMVAAMGVVMLLSMWDMYEDRRLNAILLVVFIGGFLGALALGRTSALVGDRQFLESMIPHHSRAILVCQESALTDPEIITLCEQIIQSQREEIVQMEAILERY